MNAPMKCEDLFRIGQIFDRLGWPCDDATDRCQFSLLLTRFCCMCERLTAEQRRLILEITPAYTRIPPEKYTHHFFNAWNKLRQHLPADTRNVAFIRMPTMGARNKGPKSYDSVYYQQIRGHEDALRHHFPGLTIRPSFRMYRGDEHTVIVFADDYVGTGDTIVKALTQFREGCPDAAYKAVFVLALAAQQAAVQALESHGCTLIADVLLDRGISDSSIADIPRALQLMEEIGLMLMVKKPDRLGYGRSEALVTLTRTPNNTFPVYWVNKKIGGTVWSAPFPRFTGTPGAGQHDCPMPVVKREKNQSHEVHQVLKCIRDRQDVRKLDQHQIAYPRTLHYIRSLLQTGHIELCEERLALTSRGHQSLSTVVHPGKHRSREDDSGQLSLPGFSTDDHGSTKGLYVPRDLVR